MRDHNPLVIEEFNGLWDRFPVDSCPIDHFSELNNFTGIDSGFKTRDGIEPFIPKGNVVRLYNFKTQDDEGLLILDEQGNISHSVINGPTYDNILTIAGMTDFGFQSYNGRAYITPFFTYTDTYGNKYRKGMENEFVYVYKGDGTLARKAAGFPPTNATTEANQHFKAFNSQFDGLVDKGVHLVSVLDDFGNLLIEVFPVIYAPGRKEIELIEIPLGPTGTASRKIVMTHAIDPKDYTSDQASYTYYDALTIADNTTTYKRISISDANLTVVSTMPAVPTVTGLLAENTDEVGFADLGFHLFAIVYETDTGYLTALGPEVFASVNVVDIKKAIRIRNIPVSPDSFVVKRHVVATRAIQNYNGDQTGYQFYFVPEGEIPNNTDTETTVSFYDADLLEDASHLIDNFSEIPAGVTLKTYHGRMVLTTTFNDISLCYLSAQGEPEAFDQVDGLVIFPLDGQPITNAQEYRDVLYLYKKNRTAAVIDNGDDPSTWQLTFLDQGIGASVHGVATVADSGGVNIDYIIVINFSGMYVFNGAYIVPEISWKVESRWKNLDRSQFDVFQIINDPQNKQIFLSIPYQNTIWCIQYDHGLNYKAVKWWPYTFDIPPTAIAIVITDVLVIGAQNDFPA